MSSDLPTEALWLLTGTAAFAAGVLNAVAGGGSLRTFAGLVFADAPLGGAGCAGWSSAPSC